MAQATEIFRVNYSTIPGKYWDFEVLNNDSLGMDK